MATFAPAPAATNAAPVEMLNVAELSPPVPHVSTTGPSSATGTALSRIAFIPKAAHHPSTAKLFLDYLLSRLGQDIMASQSLLHAIRRDVAGQATAAERNKELGDTLKPIPVSIRLTEYLEPAKRLEVMAKWKQTARAQ